VRPRRRDEGGAVAILTAVCLVLVVTSAAFAVDLGMQRVVRSDMQALADAVALDAARLLDGRNAGQIRAGSAGQPALAAAVAASAARNDDTVLGDVDDVTATLVYLDSGPNGEWTPRRAGGVLVSVPDSTVPDAVLVEAAGGVDFAFATGRGSASRDAMATASPFACFRLGSYAAALDSRDSAIASVFESSVGSALGISLTAVGYQGLLTSYVGLDALAAKLSVGSVDQLANLNSLEVKDLLAAGASVLGSQGDSQAAAQLSAIAANVTSGLRIDLGDILSVGDGSAAKGSINAVDLLGSAAFAAVANVSNGTNFIDSGVAWSGVSAGNVRLKAIEAPRQACGVAGEATATTTNLELESTVLPYTPPGAIQVGSASFGVALPASTTGITASARLADATGVLKEIACGSEAAIGVDISSRALNASVTLPLTLSVANWDVTGESIVSNSLLSQLFPTVLPSLITRVTVTASFGVGLSASAQTYDRAPTLTTYYRVPPHNYQDVEPSDGSDGLLSLSDLHVTTSDSSTHVTVKVTYPVGLGSTTVSQTTTLDQLDLSSVLQAVGTSAAATAVSSVGDSLDTALTQIQTLTGLRMNGADLFGVPRPNCSVPSLVG
jgi:uncharacterized membrane protein